MVYVAIIGLAGLVVSERAAFLTAAGSAVAYSLMLGAEYGGLLTHRVAFVRPPERQAAAAVFVSACLFLAAWVVTYAVRQIRSVYERAEELRNEAVSALAHDLKNPLNVILGYAEMLADMGRSDINDVTQRIRLSAQQALDFVHNALDAAAIHGKPLVPNLEPVRLTRLIREVVEQYRPVAGSKGVAVISEVEGSPVVHVDPQLLTRAVSNLVSNGIKYTPPGGTVHIGLTAATDAVALAVTDSGPGIAHAEQAHLFRPYSRTSSARGVEGTGLGLYIVRRIAEAHRGSVAVRSEVGRGSTFTLRIPILSVQRPVTDRAVIK
jgi:signal transduction histidine kinase